MSQFNRLVFSILLLVSASACGRSAVYDVGEFQPYVDRFTNEAANRGKSMKVTDLVIKYGQLQRPLERGACEISPDEPPTITIRQDTWLAMTEAEREELLFHELGHCVLRRLHKSDVAENGLPVSIMNPFIVRGDLYSLNQDYYLDELFSPGR